MVLIGALAVSVVTAGVLARQRAWQARWVGGGLTVCVVALAPSALFGLTSVGVNRSWTGTTAPLDGDWLRFGLVLSLLWANGLALLLFGRGRPAERMVPLLFVGLLMSFGAAQVYGWELRDANAYVSSVALPELRAELGNDAVPSEVSFEAETGTAAIITNREWLRTFNSTAAANDGIREIQATSLTRRQLVAVGLGFVAVAAVWLLSLFDWRRLSPMAPHMHKVLAGLFGVSVLSGVPASLGTRLPALVQIGGISLTVFELVKIVGIGAFALATAARAQGDATARWSQLLIIGSIGVLALLDLGAGLTVAAIGLTMSTLTMRRRMARLTLAAIVAIPLLAPVAATALGSQLPGAATTRITDWSDPWSSHDEATIDHLILTSARDIEAAIDERATPVKWGAAVSLIQQELTFRLTTGGPAATRPVIPLDATDERLLVEAEQAWAELGGYQATSPEARSRVVSRLVSYVDGLSDQRRALATVARQDGFQLQRSLYALRVGGLAGTGFGEGRPEAIPTVTEDLALVAWGEATGLAGIAIVIILILALTDFAIRPVKRSALLPALLLLGLGSQFAIQAIVNAGGVIGALPFTGVPFPFISRSGTSAVGSGLAVGTLIVVLDRHGSRTFFRGTTRNVPQVLGLGAGIAVVGASFALLMSTGSRLLTPGPLFASLDDIEEVHLLVPDQWASPDARSVRGPIVDRRGEPLLVSPELGSPRSAADDEVATSLSHVLRQLDLSFANELDVGPGQGLAAASLVTTLDADVQLAAHRAFDTGTEQLVRPDANLRGAVVLLDASTGDVLAMVSRPTFGLNELVDPSVWARAEGRDRRGGFDSRFLNRAFQGRYPPGSTFKTVTAAGALQDGLHSLGDKDFVYLDGPTGPQQPDGFEHADTWHQLPLTDGPPITDGNHPHIDDWRFDIEEAFAYSCNVAFAEMGLELGADALVRTARALGFEKEVRITGLGTSISTLDGDADLPAIERGLAATDDAITRTAFGQADVLATPMSMAMIAAAVANDGTIMQPRIVDGLRSGDGTWLRRTPTTAFVDTGFDAATIAGLRRLFDATVEFGTGAAASGADGTLRVGGKTGTSEWGDDGGIPHSMFIGAYPIDAPRLAVAVVVEEGGAGGGAAAAVASHLLGSDAISTYLESNGVTS